MALSVTRRRRSQSTLTHGQFSEPPIHAAGSGHASKFLPKQRLYLTRGLSVGRSIENIRQKGYAPGVGQWGRQLSIESSSKFAVKVTNGKSNTGAPSMGATLVAWSSTSSLLDNEEHLNENIHNTNADPDNFSEGSKKVSDKNRINLNIVLSRPNNELEAIHSDIESSTEWEDSQTTKTQSAPPGKGGDTKNCSNNNVIPLNRTEDLRISPALTIQPRPPLVRAMSAPVRSLDGNAKIGGNGANKRQSKFRRRKLLTRNMSCEKPMSLSAVPVPGTCTSSLIDENVSSDSMLLTGDSSLNKKVLLRVRNVAAPDVITLVSLLSSEGSDSDHEDSSTTSTPKRGDREGSKQKDQLQEHVQRSESRRAPLLHKTGKSVSFQDSYPPTFQLASKEYSHIIRRGSLAPLAARIRSNRPPTAPPVSVFHNESRKHSDVVAAPSQADDAAKSCGEVLKLRITEKENQSVNSNVQQATGQLNYPVYVRSIKERECWKLYQKMCTKGVSVTYDTVLRGMLTPTEFRLFQRQRELEEAKAQEDADAAAGATGEGCIEKDRQESVS